MTWLEVSLAVAPSQVDAAADVFRRFCYGGVAVEEPIIADPGGELYATNAGQPWIVKGYLPVNRGIGLRRTHLRRALEAAGFEPFHARALEEEDWANSWKAYFKPVRAGRHLIIRPAWEDYTAAPDDIVLDLDPGMAFGTGTHATTRLCLAAIEGHLQAGWKVLDLGTGSGILSIAAARLGAEAVLAADTDSVAISAAKKNIALNGLAGRITLVHGSIDHPAVRQFGPVDLLLANLTSAILLALAQPMVAALRPGGLLILSGVLAERQQQVADCLTALRCVVLAEEHEEDWCGLLVRGPGGAPEPAAPEGWGLH